MNLTLGEENALTGDSIRTILDRVKANLTSEKDRIIQKEHWNVFTMQTWDINIIYE